MEANLLKHNEDKTEVILFDSKHAPHTAKLAVEMDGVTITPTNRGVVSMIVICQWKNILIASVDPVICTYITLAVIANASQSQSSYFLFKDW